MKNKIIISLLSGFLFMVVSCKKDPLNTTMVIHFSKADQENAPADDITALELVAVVPADADPQTQVVFTTDIGTFLNSNSRTITVSTDENGKATAYIKSSQNGTATIKAVVAAKYTAMKTVNFITPDADNIFTIAPFTDNVSADGTSTMVLIASVNKKIPAAQSVTFNADNGATFSTGTPSAIITADGSGNAVAYLKKSVEGPVHITMSAGGVTRNITVNFSRSVPDNMLLTNNPGLTSGIANNISINISLLKTIGKPAAGYLFNYVATDAANNQIGVFSNGTASDPSGGATVNFTAGNSTYKGIVRITISLQQFPGIKSTTSVLLN